MSTFYHVFEGVLSSEPWMLTLTSDNSTGFLFNAHSAWQGACNLIWNGNGGSVAGIHGRMSTNVHALKVRSYVRDPSTGQKFEKLETDIAYNGSSSSTRLPNPTCLSIVLEGAGATRQDRGRFYLPPFSIDQCSFGGVITAAITGSLDAVKAALQYMISLGYIPSLWHRGSGTTSPIVAISTTNQWHTLKSRQNLRLAVRTRETL
jgi:hypothetical protein